MNKIAFFPFPVLTTARLILRQITTDDSAEIKALPSDKRILKYLIIEKCNSSEEAMQFIDKINKGINNNEWVYWGISFKNDKKLIGIICIWHISEENSRAEIRYALHPDEQQKGIMSEALDAVLNYGFTTVQLHSMEANLHLETAPQLNF